MQPVLYDSLTPEERRRVRNAYVASQAGKCCHCGIGVYETPVQNKKIVWSKFPPGFLKNPVHLHHSHKTGLTIGAVHAYCNAVLWQYHGE